ncbi:MAG TPA: amino acid ABC transporter permease [Mycobacteriales bacterium]|nr:amino acid ABC transporter permease [Mycobacteriales bacterium]
MTTTSREAPAATGGAPEDITAVPVRHPGRWIGVAVLAVLVAMLVNGVVNNDAYHWDTVGKYVFDQRLSAAAVVTLELTVLAMFFAVVLGVILAVMRLSPNPILSSAAWVYLWVFRGTPVYTQLVFWGLISVLYPKLGFGIPFGPEFVSFQTQNVITFFVAAVIGLSLNESAYMAEIVRAGITSVDLGQNEAAAALGMQRTQIMRRIVLPQAMRVIIPPTGNELISMLKTTSLVVAVPLTSELYSKSREIALALFQPVPLLICAALWYLAVTSVLMVGQYYLERYYARGSSRQLPPTPLERLRARLRGMRPPPARGADVVPGARGPGGWTDPGGSGHGL